MKTISFQFSSIEGFADKAIQWFEHGEFSHVDVIYEGKLIGARLDGVKIREPGYKPFKKTLIISKTVYDQQYVDAMAFLLAQVGKKYDVTAILAFAFDRNWRETDSWFCSELAAAVCEKAGIFKELAHTNKITPADFFLLLSVV